MLNRSCHKGFLLRKLIAVALTLGAVEVNAGSDVGQAATEEEQPERKFEDMLLSNVSNTKITLAARPYLGRIPDSSVDSAVKSIAREYPVQLPNGQPKMLYGTSRRMAQFAKSLEDAQVPFCLHGDGLKFQPTSIGPIGLNGVYALPMVFVAAARGACKM